MYIPKEFMIKDNKKLFHLMEENSFATLFSQHEGKPWATHLPLDIDPFNKCLYGHFAKANPHWKNIAGQEVLVVFQGPHAYISPSWYETNQTVPTWNYVSVHVYGQLELLQEESEILDSLSSLVSIFEKPESSYSLDEVDEKVKMGLQQGIAAFRIKIDSIEGKAKLSQNNSYERQKSVIHNLEQIDDENSNEIACLMKENLKGDGL